MNVELVQKEIIRQMGSNKFVAMTGSTIIAIDKGVRFRFPNKGKRINVCDVIYNEGKDLYTVLFGYWKKDAAVVLRKSSHQDVGCENLQSLFTQVTGLYTHL